MGSRSRKKKVHVQNAKKPGRQKTEEKEEQDDGGKMSFDEHPFDLRTMMKADKVRQVAAERAKKALDEKKKLHKDPKKG